MVDLIILKSNLQSTLKKVGKILKINPNLLKPRSDFTNSEAAFDLALPLSIKWFFSPAIARSHLAGFFHLEFSSMLLSFFERRDATKKFGFWTLKHVRDRTA